MDDSPPRLYQTRVEESWIDYNGHLSEAYYVLIFGFASDALYDLIGMNERHRQATSTSVYTVESHIRYLAEVPRGSSVEVATQVLGADARRLHFLHTMYLTTGENPAATSELMTLHVDTARGAVTPFPTDVAALMQSLVTAHRIYGQPASAGRAIRALTDR